MRTEQILWISRAIWIFIIHIYDCAIVCCVLIPTFQNMRHGLSRWELENYTLAHNFLYCIFCIKNHNHKRDIQTQIQIYHFCITKFIYCWLILWGDYGLGVFRWTFLKKHHVLMVVANPRNYKLYEIRLYWFLINLLVNGLLKTKCLVNARQSHFLKKIILPFLYTTQTYFNTTTLSF